MKSKINVFTILGAVLCIGSAAVLLTRANLVLVDALGRTRANLVLTMLLGGGGFSLLAGLFPNRSFTWYMNHIKLLVTVFFAAVVLITLSAIK